MFELAHTDARTPTVTNVCQVPVGPLPPLGPGVSASVSPSSAPWWLVAVAVTALLLVVAWPHTPAPVVDQATADKQKNPYTYQPIPMPGRNSPARSSPAIEITQAPQSLPPAELRESLDQQPRLPTSTVPTRTAAPRQLIAAAPPGRPYDVISGSFTLPSKVWNNSTVTCYWARPDGVEKTLPPRAKDLVVFMHYPDERGFWADNGGHFIDLAKSHGFTVMGVWFDRQSAEALNYFKPESRSKAYIYPESGSADTVMAAIQKVRHDFSLPELPVFCFGNSGGAIQAHLFRAYFPDEVDAIAGHGAINFATYRSRQRRRVGGPPAICQTWTAGDVGDQENAHIAERYASQGTAITAVQVPLAWGNRGYPESLNHHVATVETLRHLKEYLASVSDLRRAHAGLMPPMNAYPVRSSLQPGLTWQVTAPTNSWADVITAAYPLPVLDLTILNADARYAPSHRAGCLVLVSRPDTQKISRDLAMIDDADPEWDMRDYAERGIPSVLIRNRPLLTPRELQAQVPGPRASHVFLDCVDPTEEDLRTWGNEPAVISLTIGLSRPWATRDLDALMTVVIKTGKPSCWQWRQPNPENTSLEEIGQNVARRLDIPLDRMPVILPNPQGDTAALRAAAQSKDLVEFLLTHAGQ